MSVVVTLVQLFAILLFVLFKQKTAYEMRISDLSSDVCSSDLPPSTPRGVRGRSRPHEVADGTRDQGPPPAHEVRGAPRVVTRGGSVQGHQRGDRKSVV